MEESQARIDFLADAWQTSEECRAVSAWEAEVPYPDMLEVHRVFKVGRVTGCTGFV